MYSMRYSARVRPSIECAAREFAAIVRDDDFGQATCLPQSFEHWNLVYNRNRVSHFDIWALFNHYG
jgi:hypothetical protein